MGQRNEVVPLIQTAAFSEPFHTKYKNIRQNLLLIRSRVYQVDNLSVNGVKVLIDSLCTC